MALRIVKSESDTVSSQKVTPCGISGLQIVITDTFIRSFLLQYKKGVAAHQMDILKEWAKYRWGVFDERGILGVTQFYNINYELENVRCSRTRESIMFNADISNNQFCGKVKPGPQDTKNLVHYDTPPTFHNQQCDRKSTWDVINAHNDFVDISPAGIPGKRSFMAPKVRAVKRDHRKVVFIYDTTSSSDYLYQMIAFIKKGIYIALSRPYRVLSRKLKHSGSIVMSLGTVNC